MRCEDFELMCGDFLNDGTSASEMEAHVSSCERCSKYLESVRNERKALAGISVSAPEDFDKQLFRRLISSRRRIGAVRIAAGFLIGIVVGGIIASSFVPQESRVIVRTEYVATNPVDPRIQKLDPEIARIFKKADEEKLKIVNRLLWEMSRKSGRQEVNCQ